jgi:hypothetical protein
VSLAWSLACFASRRVSKAYHAATTTAAVAAKLLTAFCSRPSHPQKFSHQAGSQVGGGSLTRTTVAWSPDEPWV